MYSLVTKIAAIITLAALAVIHSLLVHQMDVKRAFLNGDLEEEIYMSQLEGCVVLRQENKVCKFRNSPYGLWYEKFDNTVVQNGYVVNTYDSCYIQR